MMNSTLYFPFNKKNSIRLDRLIQQYNLRSCLFNSHERVLKNTDMIIMVRSKYIFIRVFSECDNMRLIPNIKAILEG